MQHARRQQRSLKSKDKLNIQRYNVHRFALKCMMVSLSIFCKTNNAAQNSLNLINKNK